MLDRKSIKKKAKISLEKHYLLFLFICLISAFIGSEFRGSLIFTDGIEKTLTTQISDAVTEVSDQTDIGINSSEVIDTINKNLEPIKNSDIAKTITETVEPINKNLKNFQNTTTDSLKLRGEKGIFATIINSISSSNIILILSKGILSIIDSENISFMIAIIFTILLWLAFMVFVIEVYRVIERRIFLEGRLYEDIPSNHFIILFKARKILKISFTMFIISMKKILWLFTIIMYPVKYYEYYMSSYIIAENPNLSSKEVLKISKQLMKGNKWKTFIFDLSFIGWDILGYLTFGLFSALYTNSYKMCCTTELYAHLRQLGLSKDENLKKYLNDTYLFEKANSEDINKAYIDKKEYNEAIKIPNIQLGKIKKFFLKYLGINLIPHNLSKEYEEYMIKKLKSEEYIEEINLMAYPTRLSNLSIKERKTKIIDNINYLKPYTASSLISMFFIMCLIGWTWEVTLNFITTGEFVNKGMLHGPWLPIYGSGGLLILTFLYSFRKRPKKEFFTIIILCGTVEYFSSLIIEIITNGKRWWDYTGYFLNLNGRICAEGLLAFGIGGMVIVYFAAPLLDSIINRINKKFLICLLTALLTIFVMDIIYSKVHPNTGKGITEYSKNTYYNINENLNISPC